MRGPGFGIVIPTIPNALRKECAVEKPGLGERRGVSPQVVCPRRTALLGRLRLDGSEGPSYSRGCRSLAAGGCSLLRTGSCWTSAQKGPSTVERLHDFAPFAAPTEPGASQSLRPATQNVTSIHGLMLGHPHVAPHKSWREFPAGLPRSREQVAAKTGSVRTVGIVLDNGSGRSSFFTTTDRDHGTGNAPGGQYREPAVEFGPSSHTQIDEPAAPRATDAASGTFPQGW